MNKVEKRERLLTAMIHHNRVVYHPQEICNMIYSYLVPGYYVSMPLCNEQCNYEILIELESTYRKSFIRRRILKKSYSVWSGMLNRCYNKKHPNKAYIGCSVCEEWYNYTNFEKWFDENYYTIDGEEIELDKDILIRGNKIYSPDTCIFVPKRINSLFISLNKNNNKTIGIDWKEKIHKYQVRCCFENDRKYIGVYSTEEESFNAYKQFKESYVKTNCR